MAHRVKWPTGQCGRIKILEPTNYLPLEESVGSYQSGCAPTNLVKNLHKGS
jgi:hypothetical protein